MNCCEILSGAEMEKINLDKERKEEVLILAKDYLKGLSLMEDLEMAEVEKMDISLIESMSNKELESCLMESGSISNLYFKQKQTFMKMLELEAQSKDGREFIYNDIFEYYYSKKEVAEMLIDFYS